MATIEWQVRKETFNPNKNYFDITTVDVSRETSEEEDRLSCKHSLCCNLGGWIMMIGILGSLFGGAALGALEWWIAFAVVFPLFVATIFVGLGIMNRSQKYADALDAYKKEHDVWTTPEVEAVRRYNKEQQEIADKWRAEHPFEEQIRQCLLDPKSSVDIAKAAIIYVENYFDRES